ncbi:hypothetical protein LAZ39_09970 [Cereibacter sphaeroides]|nr:hypothetical protein [Cereibacter sphaeroides]
MSAMETRHQWIIIAMIMLIEYAERNGLHDVEKILTRAAERVAPKVAAARREFGPPPKMRMISPPGGLGAPGRILKPRPPLRLVTPVLTQVLPPDAARENIESWL